MRIKDGAALSRARSARLERDHAGVVDGQQSYFACLFRTVSFAQQEVQATVMSLRDEGAARFRLALG